MSNYQQFPDDIRKQISNFQGKLTNLNSFKGTAKEEAIVLQQNSLKRIKRNIDAYKYSIESGLFEEKIASHKSQHKEFQQIIVRLQKNLQVIRNDIGTGGLFDNRAKDKDKIDYNNRQVVIQLGNNAQKESQQAFKRMEHNIGQMDKRVDDIIIEMNDQINKLDQIYDNLNDTQTTLKRAEQHLKDFAKQIYTDRLMICMIIVIALAIIVIIGLAIAGKTPKATNGTVK